MKTRNESRQNTRETRQTTIFSQKLLPDVTRWRHDIVMVLAHIFYVINDLPNIVKLQTLLSRFTGMDVVELFYVFDAYISQSLR